MTQGQGGGPRPHPLRDITDDASAKDWRESNLQVPFAAACESDVLHYLVTVDLANKDYGLLVTSDGDEVLSDVNVTMAGANTDGKAKTRGSFSVDHHIAGKWDDIVVET